MSLDGYIADKEDDLSFLDIVNKKGEDYGYSDFLNSIDTVITGRRTYDWVIDKIGELPNKNLNYYVITRNPQANSENIVFFNGNICNLVGELKNIHGKNIFLEGGGQIVSQFLKNKLIDEFIISVIPIILGNGIRLFTENYPKNELNLISFKAFDTGLLKVHYVRK